MLAVRGGISLHREKKPRYKPKKLDDLHLGYILSDATLRDQAHLSLRQRTVMFHRMFPETSISSSTLARIYKSSRVTFKYIKRGKHPIDFTSAPYKGMLHTLQDEVTSVVQAGVKLIFLDECMFTFNTFASKTWFSRGQTLDVPERAYSLKA